MKSIYALLATAAVLFSPAIADDVSWGISWLTNDDCTGHRASYGGTGENVVMMSSNLVPGEPGEAGENCQWRLDMDSEDWLPCTAPMNPPPKSFMFFNGACRIGSHAHKASKNNMYEEDQAWKCLRVEDIEKIYVGEPFYFQCGNELP